MGGVTRVFSKPKKRTAPVSAPERREETAKKTAPEQKKQDEVGRPRGDRLTRSGSGLLGYEETSSTLGVRNPRQ